MITVALLLLLPRILKKVPAPLVALTLVSLAVVALDHLVPGFHATTIGSKFSFAIGNEVVAGIPPLPPLPVVPWQMEGDADARAYQMIRELLPAAFAIAMLGAIESLMSAVVADGMSGTQHDPNSELIALGIANIVCPFFGGIAATGALARTATNIRAGARSPIAAVVHAVFVLACTIVLAPLVAYLPMAALAGLLIVVARNMSEARHFVRLTRIAPRSDVMVMLTCFVLTVAFDMVIAVTFGVMLAALLFMRRMAVLTRSQLQSFDTTKFDVPAGVRVYEIAGPLFFGAAKTAMEALHVAGDADHTVILSMQHVPTMDATGLVALESVLDRLHRSKVKVIFAGAHHRGQRDPRPRRASSASRASSRTRRTSRPRSAWRSCTRRGSGPARSRRSTPRGEVVAGEADEVDRRRGGRERDHQHDDRDPGREPVAWRPEAVESPAAPAGRRRRGRPGVELDPEPVERRQRDPLEGREHPGCRRRALGGRLDQHPREQRVELGRQRGSALGQPRRGLVDVHRHDLAIAVGDERRARRSAARTGCSRPRRDPRARRSRPRRGTARAPCRPACRGSRRPGSSPRPAGRSIDELGDPEVEDLDRIAAGRGVVADEEDVVGLEIAVDHARGVRGVERREQLHRDLGGERRRRAARAGRGSRSGPRPGAAPSR